VSFPGSEQFFGKLILKNCNEPGRDTYKNQELLEMSECALCNEVITNPVCIDCVENEIAAWLYEVKPELVKELRRKSEEIDLDYGETHCILCKNYMSICTFCYTNHIFEWLKIRVPEFIREFRTFFDFNYFFPI